MQVQAALGHVELDHVAVVHQRQGATGSRFRCGVQDHGAVGGAAHAGVADAHHVSNAFTQYLGRQRHVADFGHAGVALGAAVLEHHHAVLVDVQGLVVNAGVKVFDGFKHHSATGVHHECRRGGAGLDDRATWRQVAAQHSDTGFFFEGRRQRLDHIGIEVLSVSDVGGHRLAVGGDEVQMQVLGNFLHDHRQAAGVAEIFHQVLA